MPLTPVQLKTSVCISDTVSKFPTDISHIVSQYTVDFHEAEMPLEFNRKNRLQNPQLREYIKDALISHDCSTLIKRGIFQLAQSHGYRPQLNTLLIEIAQQGHVVNLDGVDLSHLNMSDYDLRNMSAVGANFSHCQMRNSKFDKADLTGAVMRSANLENVSFTDAILYKSCITDSNLKNAQLSRVIAWGMVLLNLETEQTEVTGIVTDDQAMRNVVFENLRWGAKGKFVSELSLKLFDENHYRESVERNRSSYKIRA